MQPVAFAFYLLFYKPYFLLPAMRKKNKVGIKKYQTLL